MYEQDREEFDVEGHQQAPLADDKDVEGHRLRQADGPDEDVEGHRIRHGSNLTSDDDEDVEGHRYLDVQPPRDTDLGGTDR